MSYHYTIDQDINLLVVKLWGKIPCKEEAQAVFTVLDDPRIGPGGKIFVDRTDSSFTCPPEDVRAGITGREKDRHLQHTTCSERSFSRLGLWNDPPVRGDCGGPN